MAIYSCNLASIGRTTHLPGTAGAHIRYISREGADPVTMSNHMPLDPVEGRNWMDQTERAARKNARLLDKIRIALPRELNEDERYQLVQDFMHDLCGNRIPWYAAIHQSGKDAHNPHVHIAVHDRDIETGLRHLRLSDSTRDRIRDDLPGPKAVEWVRQVWEYAANRALEMAGHSERIDRRTLEAQGIDRLPTIHEGPRGSHISDHVHKPVSKLRETFNNNLDPSSPYANEDGRRIIDYPSIDRGQTRREFNAQIIDLNLERAARSDHPETAVWAQFEKQQMDLDHKLEARLIDAQQRRTAQLRNISRNTQSRYEAVRAEARLKHRQTLKRVQDKFASRRDTLRARQQHQRKALSDKHSSLRARILKTIDITGHTRRKQEAARKELSRRHKVQRTQLKKAYSEAKEAALGPLTQKYRERLAQIKTNRSTVLKSLKNDHRQAEVQADKLRQQREADREQSRRLTEAKIQKWRKDRQDRQQKQKEQQQFKLDPLARALILGEPFKLAAGGNSRGHDPQTAEPAKARMADQDKSQDKTAPIGKAFEKAATSQEVPKQVPNQAKEQDILKKPRRRKDRRPASERYTVRDNAISDKTIGKEFGASARGDEGQAQDKDILKKPRRRKQRRPADERYTIRDGKDALSDKSIGREFDARAQDDQRDGEKDDQDKKDEKDILKKPRRRRRRDPRDKGRGRER